MIPHIDKLFAAIIFSLLIACEKSAEALVKEAEVKNDSVTSSIVPKAEKKVNRDSRWVFYKVVSLSENVCKADNFKEVKFVLFNDSVFINGTFADAVYKSKIKSNQLFQQKYVYQKYVKVLSENFDVKLPEVIETIRNKRAYEKDSKLDNYFREAFFIENYLFFESNRCLFCFKRDSESQHESLVELEYPISSTTILKNKAPKINGEIFSEYACGSQAYGYFLDKIDECDIYIVQNDCGDFPFKDLVIIKNNAIVSKILIESESWDIERMESEKIKDEAVTSFEIDEHFTIVIKTVKKLNSKISSEVQKKYKIIDSQVVEI